MIVSKSPGIKKKRYNCQFFFTYVYRIGLLNGDYGYSTAVGLFNSVVNVILLVFVNWVVKKLNDGEGL